MSVRELWETYRRDVVPRDAQPVQVQESRRAFYAGANGAFTAVLTSNEPGELFSIEAELVAFVDDVAAGRA